MGGLPMDAAAAPMLGELGLVTALGVSLMDKETQSPAGVGSSRGARNRTSGNRTSPIFCKR